MKTKTYEELLSLPIDKSKIISVCSEIGLKPYYENHSLYNEIYDYLKIYGFEISETPYPFPYPSKGGTPNLNTVA